MSSTQNATLLNLVAKHGSESQIKYLLNQIGQSEQKLDAEIIGVVALKTIEWLSSNHKLGQLYQLSRVLQNLGFSNESNIGFGEIGSQAQDTELQEMVQKGLQGRRDLERRVGLPEWFIDHLCQRSIYREKDGDSDYQCFKFENLQVGKRGTAEFISLRRLNEGGFSDFSEWEAYLRDLHKRGVVSLLNIGYSPDCDARIYCLYEIPAGMKTLAECMSEEEIAGFITPSVNVAICRTLTRMLADVNSEESSITCVDTLNVLWNPIEPGSIKLVNIGASLTVPRYHCGITGCREPASRSEIGITTITFFIGLMMLQMLRKSCPLLEIGSLQPNSIADRQSVTKLLDVPNTPPQLRSIIGRLISSEPEDRYTNLEYLYSDLNAVWEFLSNLPERSFQDQRDNTWYTLSSHTEFRLAVAMRNPKIQALSPPSKVSEVLGHVSRDLEYLTEEMLSLWDTKIHWRTDSQFFPTTLATRDLYPEGRRLLGIAEGWENQLATCGSTPHLSGLTKLILYRIVSIEATACAASLAKYSGHSSKSYVSRILHTISKWEDLLQGNKSHATLLVEIPVHDNSKLFEFRVSVTKADVGYLREFLTWSHGSGSKAFELQPMPLKTMVLIFILLAIGGHIVLESNSSRPDITSEPVFDNPLKPDETWQLVHYLSELDQEIDGLTSQRRSTPGESKTAWLHVFTLVAMLRKLRSADRRSAMIQYSQRTFTEGAGYAQLVVPHWGSFTFTRSNVFISGNIRNSSESRQPARVDVVKVGPTQILASVLAPTDLFRSLPKPDRTVSLHRMADWIRRNQKLTAFIVVAISIVLLNSFALFLKSAFGVSVPWLTTLVGLPMALVPEIVATVLSGILDNVFPEDATNPRRKRH